MYFEFCLPLILQTQCRRNDSAVPALSGAISATIINPRIDFGLETGNKSIDIPHWNTALKKGLGVYKRSRFGQIPEVELLDIPLVFLRFAAEKSKDYTLFYFIAAFVIHRRPVQTL